MSKIKVSILVKIQLTLGILSVFFIVNIMLVIFSDRETTKKVQQVYHTQEVLIKSERLLLALTDAETGQRGYLLTLNPDYLSIYQLGVEKVEILYKELFDLISENQEQQVILKKILGLKNKKMEELAKTIHLANKGTDESMTQAIDIVNSHYGKTLMDSIRREIAVFNDRENDLLKKRENTYEQYQSYTYILFFILVIFYVLFSLVILLIVQNKILSPLQKIASITEMVKVGKKQDRPERLSTDEMGQIFTQLYGVLRPFQRKVQREPSATLFIRDEGYGVFSFVAL
jgi:CHASE3 domain sensor protein